MVRRLTYGRKDFIKLVAGAAIAIPATGLIGAPDPVEARIGNQQLSASKLKNSRIMRVQAIDFSHHMDNATVRLESSVNIVLNTGNVANASVSVRFTLADGSVHSQMSKTDDNGIARFSRNGAGYGTYRVEVTSVKRGGLVYRRADNLITSAVIEIQQPAPDPIREPITAPDPLVQDPPPAEGGINVLNVRDFGARGDGVTDDSEAIQRTISQLSESGGGTVFLPAGNYLVGRTIWLGSGVYLVGENRDATVLSTRMNMNTIEAISISNTGLRNLTLQGVNDSARWGYGLFASEVNGLHVEACRFADLPDAALYLMRVDGVSVSATEFNRIRLTGVRFAPAREGFANRNIHISNSTFLRTNVSRSGGHSAIHFHGGEAGCKNEHIRIENNHVESEGIGLGLDDVDHAVVTGNRIIGNGAEGEGIALTGSNNTITNNVVSDNYAAGILIWGMAHRSNDNNVISGNTCFDNSQGIAIVCGDHGTVIENAAIENNRCYAEKHNSRQQYGFQHYIDGTTDFTWRGVRIANNDFRGNTRDGINIIPPAQAEFVNNQV